MTSKALPTKCCEVQLLPDGPPSREWTPEQLLAYARAQNEAINDDECKLAVRYWRLGSALNLLRPNFQHGQWEHALKRLGIHKSTASRAKAIACTFASEAEVAGLTATAAYEQRVRKRRKGTTNSSTRKARSPLRRFLSSICETADKLIDDAAFMDRNEANELLPAVRVAIRRLQTIHAWLDKQAGTAQVSH